MFLGVVYKFQSETFDRAEKVKSESETTLAPHFFAILAHSTISLVVNGDLKKIDAKVIFECAQAGDALANNIVNQAIEYLGIAIASAVNFLDPQLIILEGGVSRAGEALQLPLTQEVERHVMPFREHSVNIMTSHLGSDAAAIGAAAFLLKNLVEHGGKIQLSE